MGPPSGVVDGEPEEVRRRVEPREGRAVVERARGAEPEARGREAEPEDDGPRVDVPGRGARGDLAEGRDPERAAQQVRLRGVVEGGGERRIAEGEKVRAEQRARAPRHVVVCEPVRARLAEALDEQPRRGVAPARGDRGAVGGARAFVGRARHALVKAERSEGGGDVHGKVWRG